MDDAGYAKNINMKNSLKETIIAMDRAVPRYTSYPTAVQFEKPAHSKMHLKWLESIDKDECLSLYIHIPFCSGICWYCGCHTKATRHYGPVLEYVELILKEINLLADILGSSHKVEHIHFGGGSPGILKPYDFKRIMEALDKAFDINYELGEIAIEIDPRGVSEEKIIAYSDAGINRVSLGVQDTNERTLKAVNRIQPFELSVNAACLLKENGIKNLNIDLLYGLPFQNVENMSKSVDKIMELSPDRISLFGYAHVPWMKKHMRLIDEGSLPDKYLRYDLFDTAEKKLLGEGYVPIGIDHFAKKDDSMALAALTGNLRRNFQGYTTDKADILLGIGASSIGKLTQGYIQNAVDMPVYSDFIQRGELPVGKICSLTSEDFLRSEIIERLMCDFKADIPYICRKHGVGENRFDHVLANLDMLMEKNMLVISEEKILTIIPHARLAARLICAEFDEYFSYTPEKPRHAKAI